MAQPGAGAGAPAAAPGAGFARQPACGGPLPGGERSGIKVFEFSSGSICGVVDTYMHRPRSSCATVAGLGGGSAAGSGACRVLRIGRADLGRMAAEAPSALHVLQARRGGCGTERGCGGADWVPAR